MSCGSGYWCWCYRCMIDGFVIVLSRRREDEAFALMCPVRDGR
jgi:hypothetical protein